MMITRDSWYKMSVAFTSVFFMTRDTDCHRRCWKRRCNRKTRRKRILSPADVSFLLITLISFLTDVIIPECIMSIVRVVFIPLNPSVNKRRIEGRQCWCKCCHPVDDRCLFVFSFVWQWLKSKGDDVFKGILLKMLTNEIHILMRNRLGWWWRKGGRWLPCHLPFHLQTPSALDTVLVLDVCTKCLTQTGTRWVKQGAQTCTLTVDVNKKGINDSEYKSVW